MEHLEISPKTGNAQDAIQKSLDSVTGDEKTGIAGMVFCAVDKNGKQLAACASGKRGLNSKEPMTMDTVFWMASCTKLLTAIVCMQLVEKGVLSLDDPKQVYKLAPELEKIKVLDGGKLVDRKEDITLRMLMNHTAGFGYEVFNLKLRDYGRPVGFNAAIPDEREILRMPLVNQPGSRWEYGMNMEWAGILATRASGKKLNELFQENIMQPLGIKSVNMFPTDEMKKNLAFMHQRWPGSDKSEECDHLYRAPILAETDDEKKHIFNGGGIGAFGKPAEYCQVLAALLNDGKSPTSGAQILKPETVKEMFKNQIEQFPDFARQGMPAGKPEQINPLPELYPQEGNPPQGWGMGFLITLEAGATGRGRNTGQWVGVPNLFWWCDREKGVAGIIAAQIMPLGDQHVMGQWIACETAVYASLS